MAKSRKILWNLTIAMAVGSVLMLAMPLAAGAKVATVAKITLSPKSGHASSSVKVSGSGFTAGGHVRIELIGPKKNRTVVDKSVTVTSNGTFSVSVKIPSTAAKGKGAIVAMDHVHKKHAKATFTVT